ncbi:hypothetical protein PV11_04141 [Exophiala sideris]|uniref:Uncharacterized protein n=1 Tax=Exophiala sideris TaxID=1016849 RepID=A0A0D1W011_9EURO|nr:hypothetical protein PV11_04141 [Exophiala sideris]
MPCIHSVMCRIAQVHPASQFQGPFPSKSRNLQHHTFIVLRVNRATLLLVVTLACRRLAALNVADPIRHKQALSSKTATIPTPSTLLYWPIPTVEEQQPFCNIRSSNAGSSSIAKTKTSTRKVGAYASSLGAFHNSCQKELVIPDKFPLDGLKIEVTQNVSLTAVGGGSRQGVSLVFSLVSSCFRPSIHCSLPALLPGLCKKIIPQEFAKYPLDCVPATGLLGILLQRIIQNG